MLAKWINSFLVALPEMRPVQHWIQRGSCPQWPASCNAQCSVTWYSAKKKKWIKYITKKFYKSALNQITYICKFYRNTLQKQYSGFRNIHGMPIITEFIAESFHKMFIKLKYVTTLFYRQDHWPQIYTMMPMNINEFTIHRNPTAGTCVLTSVIEQRARIAGPLNWSSFPVISFIKL